MYYGVRRLVIIIAWAITRLKGGEKGGEKGGDKGGDKGGEAQLLRKLRSLLRHLTPRSLPHVLTP